MSFQQLTNNSFRAALVKLTSLSPSNHNEINMTLHEDPYEWEMADIIEYNDVSGITYTYQHYYYIPNGDLSHSFTTYNIDPTTFTLPFIPTSDATIELINAANELINF